MSKKRGSAEVETASSAQKRSATESGEVKSSPRVLTRSRSSVGGLDFEAVSSLVGSIRRFDVFAEWTRQEKANSLPDDVAKGEAVWLAKFVACRRGGAGGAGGGGVGGGGGSKGDRNPEEKWKSLNGVDQTDVEFDKCVIQKVGSALYYNLLVPGVRNAQAAGLRYDDVRGPSGTSHAACEERRQILLRQIRPST